MGGCTVPWLCRGKLRVLTRLELEGEGSHMTLTPRTNSVSRTTLTYESSKVIAVVVVVVVVGRRCARVLM